MKGEDMEVSRSSYLIVSNIIIYLNNFDSTELTAGKFERFSFFRLKKITQIIAIAFCDVLGTALPKSRKAGR
jgi:hypothetical protein